MTIAKRTEVMNNLNNLKNWTNEDLNKLAQKSGVEFFCPMNGISCSEMQLSTSDDKIEFCRGANKCSMRSRAALLLVIRRHLESVFNQDDLNHWLEVSNNRDLIYKNL